MSPTRVRKSPSHSLEPYKVELETLTSKWVSEWGAKEWQIAAEHLAGKLNERRLRQSSTRTPFDPNDPLGSIWAGPPPKRKAGAREKWSREDKLQVLRAISVMWRGSARGTLQHLLQRLGKTDVGARTRAMRLAPRISEWIREPGIRKYIESDPLLTNLKNFTLTPRSSNNRGVTRAQEATIQAASPKRRSRK